MLLVVVTTQPRSTCATHPAATTSTASRCRRPRIAGTYAIDYFVEQLPTLLNDRKHLQETRTRSDADVLPLFRQALEPAYGEPGYLAGYRSLVEAFGIEASVQPAPHASSSSPASRSARAWPGRRFGPGRSRARSRPSTRSCWPPWARCSASSPDFSCRSVAGRDLRKLEQWCDVVIFQGLILSIHPWLKKSTKVLVADLYDPFHLEVLEQEKDKSDAIRLRTSEDTVHALNIQLVRGDYFMCASAKQRDFWIGQLAGVGRVNPATYDLDETLDKLIGVVPFGIAEEPPVRSAPAIKGVVPGIVRDDSVILWGGGIYNWFDPLTLIRAVDRLRHRRPDVRLYFLGIKHPNPDVPEMRMSVQTRELSDQLGLTDTFVFFNEGWVPYEQRQNYLLDADIGVSCHLDHVETAYSFRTRILDYIWASLPVVTTQGDTFGDLVSSLGLGVAVPPQDVDALEEALFRLLDDQEFASQCRKQVAELAPRYTWANVLAPLADFCRAPRRAPDLLDEFGETSLGRASSYTEDVPALDGGQPRPRPALFQAGRRGHGGAPRPRPPAPRVAGADRRARRPLISVEITGSLARVPEVSAWRARIGSERRVRGAARGVRLLVALTLTLDRVRGGQPEPGRCRDVSTCT